MAFFQQFQGHIIPKWLVWSGQNSNSSEILVTYKFDKYLINNEDASMETSFSHYSVPEFFPVLKGA